MRAFMSPIMRHPKARTIAWPDGAMKEARAILAETEPADDTRFSCNHEDGETYLCSSSHEQSFLGENIKAILADALTTFLSTEIN